MIHSIVYIFQVPVGGCYRLIDIPMSNCINSGINKVFVLTQFNSASLNRHISRTYFGNGINFGDGYVEVCIKKSAVNCEWCISSCLIFDPVLVNDSGYQSRVNSLNKIVSCKLEQTHKDLDRIKFEDGYRLVYTTIVKL